MLCCNLFSVLLLLLAEVLHFPVCVEAAGSPVKFLPGFQGPLPFELETGYIGVGDSNDVQLFYYFIKSESNPKSDPLILWLTGGPGCSALSGLLFEIGPITFQPVEYGAFKPAEYNGSFPSLVLNPHTWTKIASFIFLDLPVGTGFSYARTSAAHQSDDLQASDHAYQFLQKWFNDHPEFLRNPFYMAGDSYSGISVPIISQLIANGNEKGLEPFINLKGYFLGNPSTFQGEFNYRIPYAHGMGLISDELFEMVEGLEPGQILEPNCEFGSLRPQKWFGERRSLDEMLYAGRLRCRGSIGKWKRCAEDDLHFQKIVHSSIPYHANLSVKGYRSLIYSGDHDMMIPYISTKAWIRSLNCSIVDDWRPWIVDSQVAGYTRTYSNKMTFATGGGHTAPEYKPVECLAMLRRWLSYQPL
uniref:Serine carboxypeptidase n=1 Tax=Solanum tuberosum TaxID=4113 RepID=M1AZE2_SOLTU